MLTELEEPDGHMGDIGKIVKSLSFIEEFVAVTGSLSKERDIVSLLNKVIASACRFTSCDGGRIYMLDVTRRFLELKVSVWHGSDTNNDWYRQRSITGSAHTGQDGGRTDGNDPLIYSTLTGNTVIVDNIHASGSLNTEGYLAHDQLNGVRTTSFIIVPLINHEDQTIGLLELVNAREPTYNRSISFKPMEAVIKAFASQAAICINNAMLIDHNEKLIEILDNSNRNLAEDNRRLRKQRARANEYRIIGRSDCMKSVFQLMDKVVDSDVTVLLRGETGTGKEVFARAIHDHSPRKSRNFVTQNCAAVPEQLLESELFGYKKGAFTGATSEKKGLFDVADGGTLFLDEIGDMPITLQSKLLRVLQENEVRPLGATQSHRVDVRIIAATHCNLENKIARGEFREDLFFRLSVFPLQLPALRQRGMDIIALAEHFIDRCEAQYGRQIQGISPAALELLMNYDYPGNVRELQNIIERAVLLCESGGVILSEYLPENVRHSRKALLSSNQAAGAADSNSDAMEMVLDNKPLKQAVNDFECEVIKQHLRCHNWNQTQTAKALQIPRRTLIDKMNRFNIKTPERRKRACH
ncbi:MAG: sigma 54-interacting transcriptional regulator [Ketobacteraceae bacterium]|nr:sigma 54-interacting transcriptional regulator [Ketobacteraceae bacterium]